jgi:hypothetical protein
MIDVIWRFFLDVGVILLDVGIVCTNSMLAFVGSFNSCFCGRLH